MFENREYSSFKMDNTMRISYDSASPQVYCPALKEGSVDNDFGFVLEPAKELILTSKGSLPEPSLWTTTLIDKEGNEVDSDINIMPFQTEKAQNFFSDVLFSMTLNALPECSLRPIQ